MSTTPVEEWVRNLRVGTLDLSDLAPLEGVHIEKVLEQIGPLFPNTFLDRCLKNKREIGLAQSSYKRAGTDTFRDCILLTSESGYLTSLAAMPYLRIRRSRQTESEFELVSGAGFNLYRDPDGWKLKLLHERTVSLTLDSLKKRGWLFIENSHR